MMNALRRYAPPWLKSLVNPFSKHAAFALALGVASACCGALLMFVSGYLICRTALPDTTLFMVMVPVAFVQLFGIGRPFAHYFERLVSHDWVFRVTSALRKRLFLAAQTIADDPANPKSSGDYLEMLADDIGHLQNLYLRVAFPTIIALIMLVCAFVFSGVFDVALGAAVLLLGIVSAVAVPSLAYVATKSLQLNVKDQKKQVYEHLTDDVLGALDWSLAGRAGDVIARNDTTCRVLSASEGGVRRRVRVFELICALILGLGVVAIAALAGTAFQGTAGGEHYIASFALGLFPLMQMFILLPGAVSDAPSHLSSISHLDDVLAAHPASEEASSPSAHSDRSGRTASAPHFENAAAISLDGVTYRYPSSEKLAAKNITLHIEAGQKVAVIGKSGSGKTTLSSLVRGAIAPSEGTVAIEGIHMPQAAELVCFVPQTPYIFDASLRDNLVMANPLADDACMVDALEKVGLGDKLSTLEDGLGAHVGETGTGFSGGEAHRIALARALLSQRPIVMLDEPFSAVDPATERMLLDTLFDAFYDKTLIVITHHLMDIERFDRVILVHDGAIELDGSPDALAETSARFCKLLDFDRGYAMGGSLE